MQTDSKVTTLPKLPDHLWKRPFMQSLFKKNLKQLFYDPRHWRLDFKDIGQIKIQFLNFSPPEYDILITASATVNGKEKNLYFYEGIITKKKPEKGERVLGKVRINDSDVYFIDGYTSLDFSKKLLETWCREEKRNLTGFLGNFLGIKGEAEVTIKMLKPLFKPGEEVTTNYLYQCKGSVETKKGETEFNVLVKRFLPREPADRGNREYKIMKALPSGMVPMAHGGLVNCAFMINGNPQMLVLFIDFIEEGVEIGKEIWDLMEEINREKEGGKEPRAKLERLYAVVQEAVDEVIFPFHQSCFEAWHSAGRAVEPQDEYYRWYFKELQENLAALKNTELITQEEKDGLLETFTEAWEKVLQDIKATEIHRDLMWRQIMRTGKGNLVILDLDEHIKGHAGKDLADVCAANRFIAEDLPGLNKDYIRGVAEKLNRLILERYLKKAKETKAGWVDRLKEAVEVYLAYRHLHDAAYYAPAWRGAVDDETRSRYKKYVEFSMKWFQKSINQLRMILKEFEAA